MPPLADRIKSKIKNFIAEDQGPNESTAGSAAGKSGWSGNSEIDAVLDAQFSALSASRIKLDKSREDVVADGKVPEAPFADFLGQFQATQGAQLTTLKKEHPFMSDFAAMAVAYMQACDKLSPTIAPLLRRHFYRFISIFNDANSAAHIFDYKKTLPRVGLCYFPNPGPKNFVIDALSGMAEIVDMEPGKMVEKVWALKGYNFDYALYQKTLKDRTTAEVDSLPEEFRKRFHSRDWLINELAAAIQYQWALVELLKVKHWDVIFVGAAETPLSLALYDVPEELLPPVVSLCHGIPSGDPIMNFFSRIDQVVVRNEPEKDFYTDMGVPEKNITFVGSTSIEDFPSRRAVQRSRENARDQLGLSDDDTVILYATTYDISIYNTKSTAETLALVLDSLKTAAARGLKNPVLYIKYHPSPASDPYFSFSRQQYPFEAFGVLEKHGFRVRLTNSIEAVLPACDAFLAHESTTLSDAIDCALPTISIKMHDSLSVPALGKRAYSETTCNKHFSVYDSAETIGNALYDLSAWDRDDVYAQSKRLWQNIFKSGRSAGLMRVAELTARLLR